MSVVYQLDSRAICAAAELFIRNREMEIKFPAAQTQPFNII
jgi:hypothetical protein